MSNIDGAFGLRPVRHINGSCIHNNEYSIASGYSTNIFYGDAVEMTGTGRNVAVSVGGNVDSIGVFQGCRYVNAQGEQVFSKYWPASTVATEVVALVVDDPDVIFEGQCDTLAAGDIGALVDYDDGAGAAFTGLSGREVVGSSTGTSGKALRVIRLVPRPDNAYGAYAKAEFMFAEHALKGVISGVGGN